MDELVGAFAGLKGAFTSHKGFAHVKLVASILEAAVAIKDIDTFVVHLTDLWEKAGVVLQKQDSQLPFIEAKKPPAFQDLDVDRCVDIMGQRTGRPAVAVGALAQHVAATQVQLVAALTLPALVAGAEARGGHGHHPAGRGAAA